MSRGGIPDDLGPTPEYPLEVHALIGHDVNVSPTSVAPGLLKVGDIRQETITFRSAHNRPFEISDVKTERHEDLQIERLASRDHEQAFRIVQRIDRPGNQSRQLQFMVKQKGRPDPYNIDVTVPYYGLAQ